MKIPSAVRCGHLAAALAVALAFAGADGFAQGNKGPANALQGFSQNRELPVKIQAAKLEVRDKRKEAIFSGDVVVTQGDTEMRCKSLVVFYDGDEKGDSKSSLKAAQPGPAGQQQIRRIEASGGVRVTQKEQNASGDTGIFDMQRNTVTLVGNVVVTRGQDVLRGQRLVVDLASGVSKIEAGQGRVEGLFNSAPQRNDAIPGGGPAMPGRPARPN